jgi:hypothetical protein
VRLPGADELFRTTGGAALHAAPRGGQTARGGAEDHLRAVPSPEQLRGASVSELAAELVDTSPPLPAAPPRGRSADRQPSGRQRHDEKITVYVSADELLDLEHARLALRAEHGLAADRGRLVREAIAVLLADFDSRGEESILVRRLRGV